MIRVGKPEIEAISRVIESGALFRYSSGSAAPTETDLFEREFAAAIATKHALAVTNGTAALVCAIAGLGIGPGDEVIIPGYTFMATATAVLLCGAIPVLAEVDDTLLLDPADVARRIGPRTKAIIPVHMCGLPCDMDGVMKVARQHKVFVIEDACQADAVSYKGRRLGAIGDVGCFSFNYYKIMTCGEGGAITTDSDEVYDRALVMHDSGLTFRPAAEAISIPTFVGLNFRLNNILAAMLRAQLAQVDGWLTRMRAIKARMLAELSARGVPLLPSNDLSGDSGMTIGLQFATEAETRQCMQAMDAKGVGYTRPFDTGRHVYCNWDPVLEHRAYHRDELNPFLHPANQECRMQYTVDMLPKTLDVLKRSLLLGIHPDMDEAKVSARIEAIAACALPSLATVG